MDGGGGDGREVTLNSGSDAGRKGTSYSGGGGWYKGTSYGRNRRGDTFDIRNKRCSTIIRYKIVCCFFCFFHQVVREIGL